MSIEPRLVACALLSLAGLGVWSQGPAAAQPANSRGSDREIRAIAALNDCIQDRFKEVDERFGFRRIIKIGETPHRFEPENVRELEAVRGLESARLQVAVYVASRALLSRSDDPASPGRTRVYRRLKGPAQITPVISRDALQTTLPEAADLLDDSQRAIAAFATRESYEFRKGDWQFTARPVRVSGRECLSCHRGDSTMILPGSSAESTLKIGDPIGAVIYAYRPFE